MGLSGKGGLVDLLTRNRPRGPPLLDEVGGMLLHERRGTEHDSHFLAVLEGVARGVHTSHDDQLSIEDPRLLVVQSILTASFWTSEPQLEAGAVRRASIG